MESATPYILFFCGTGIIGSFLIGVMIGWFGNDIVCAFLNNKRALIHPEMFDENGNIIPDEIVAVRFENDYDNNDEEEDYDDKSN